MNNIYIYIYIYNFKRKIMKGVIMLIEVILFVICVLSVEIVRKNLE